MVAGARGEMEVRKAERRGEKGETATHEAEAGLSMSQPAAVDRLKESKLVLSCSRSPCPRCGL